MKKKLMMLSFAALFSLTSLMGSSPSYLRLILRNSANKAQPCRRTTPRHGKRYRCYQEIRGKVAWVRNEAMRLHNSAQAATKAEYRKIYYDAVGLLGRLR